MPNGLGRPDKKKRKKNVKQGGGGEEKGEIAKSSVY